MAELALKQAYWQTLASGNSVLERHGGIIYEIFPDGTKKTIKEVEPPTPVTIGQKITIP
ncbi:MAG: hypothetical protein N3A62_06725 [Thermodesulfovibrionales bacterium]|nr:hypothetical protein [Thermodesulfovibrionales bacterium]